MEVPDFKNGATKPTETNGEDIGLFVFSVHSVAPFVRSGTSVTSETVLPADSHRLYWPMNRAGRFSTSAATASFWSAVCCTIAW